MPRYPLFSTLLKGISTTSCILQMPMLLWEKSQRERYSEMKKVTWFYLNGCPYCRKAEQAYEALTAANPAYQNVVTERIEENAHPDIADRYDYYFVPSFFTEEEKVYEAARTDGYEEILAGLKKALDTAMAD